MTSIKKATLDQESSLSVDSNTYGLNAREKLALRRLQQSPCDRWELARAIGRGYAPDVIQHMRIKGVPVLTTMTKVSYKIRAIGIYSLGYEDDKKARLPVSEVA